MGNREPTFANQFQSRGKMQQRILETVSGALNDDTRRAGWNGMSNINKNQYISNTKQDAHPTTIWMENTATLPDVSRDGKKLKTALQLN